MAYGRYSRRRSGSSVNRGRGGFRRRGGTYGRTARRNTGRSRRSRVSPRARPQQLTIRLITQNDQAIAAPAAQVFDQKTVEKKGRAKF